MFISAVAAFHGDAMRVYANADIVGVEVGGAVKNVLAIATGLCDGLQLGLNARAALITRGLAEMDLGMAAGRHQGRGLVACHLGREAGAAEHAAQQIGRHLGADLVRHQSMGCLPRCRWCMARSTAIWRPPT